MPGNPILGASGECAVWKKGDREFETWESFSLMLVDPEIRSSRASLLPLFLAWHYFTPRSHQNFSDSISAWSPYTSDPPCLAFSLPSSSISVKQMSLGFCWSHRVSIIRTLLGSQSEDWSGEGPVWCHRVPKMGCEDGSWVCSDLNQ